MCIVWQVGAKHCTACTKYYPEASIGDPVGKISSLTNHACGNYDQNPFNCCLYDETTYRCGVFENEYFMGFVCILAFSFVAPVRKLVRELDLEFG